MTIYLEGLNSHLHKGKNLILEPIIYDFFKIIIILVTNDSTE